MKRTLRPRTFTAVLVAILSSLLIAFSLVPLAAAASSSGFSSHKVSVRPQYQLTQHVNAPRFNCQDERPNRPLCYSPQQIRAAYNIQSLLDAGFTGKNRTIVIVDAFSNPYIESDLKIFDQTFGLPDPSFQIIAPYGQTPFDINDDNQVGWSGEISLDVLWAHAVAPSAKIVLALAKTNDDVDIYKTTKYVIDHHIGDVISQSFGEAESCVDPKLLKAQHTLFQNATRKHITLVASSGDQGAAQPNCDGTAYILSASSPASDPYVLAVGGTNLKADTQTGKYISERAWADQFSGCYPPESFGCSGGGYSTIYKRPDYQDGFVKSAYRGVPDVAYNAGVDGGVLTHWGVGNVLNGFDATESGIFFIFGGTSAGAPQMSGLAAIADQSAGKRLGLVNPAAYKIASDPSLYASIFNDITSGNNNFDDVAGYQTSRGWDAVTGLGTPKLNFLQMLKQYKQQKDDYAIK